GRRSKGVGGRGRELKNKLKLLTRPIYTKLYQVISFSLYLVNDQVYGFPTHESAAVVLKFLEDYTGKGTVYALEVKVSKEGHRAYAKVQFTNNRSAEDIISLANQWLWYGSSYLKAWEMDSDIIPMPRTYAHCMEQHVTSLYMSCHVFLLIHGPALNINFFSLVVPRRMDIGCIEHALEKLSHLKECCYNPLRWICQEYLKYRTSRKLPKTPDFALDDGLVYVRRVQITPCKAYFCGPEVNVSNCVLRNYSAYIDNFLRVSFIDEEGDKMYSMDLSLRTASANDDRRTAVYKRILSILRKGIVIGSQKFEFLAFSSSQLRDNSAWMFASRPGFTADDIRTWTGDFHQIRNVAKYAARLGQSFGSSTETLKVAKHEIEIIPDVEVVRGGVRYVFSDGIEKISTDLARRVATKCGLKSSTPPSAFQIRYGGYKGVVAVDPTLSMKLSLRKSMSKYESENTKLDVLAWS
ncbi:unnamed protein product, partial [Ilex paraguariensis]